MPKISVILPVYNVAEYLPECLDSVLGQRFGDFEVLLIDDGSTDGSGEICREYARRSGRVRLYRQENRGLSAARNAGLDMAAGEYLCFVDGDDVIHPEMLEIMVKNLENTGSDLAICNIRRLPGGDTPLEAGVVTGEALLTRLTLPEAWYYVTMPNKLIRRECFGGLRFPQGRCHEDEALIHRLLARCRRVVLVPEALYGYRRRPGSITTRDHTPDKLLALADRLEFAKNTRRTALADHTARRFSEVFLESYRSRDGKMEEALTRALPLLLPAGTVRPRHKLYLIILRFFPEIYLFLKGNIP